jgi:hypothetical protein
VPVPRVLRRKNALSQNTAECAFEHFEKQTKKFISVHFFPVLPIYIITGDQKKISQN